MSPIMAKEDDILIESNPSLSFGNTNGFIKYVGCHDPEEKDSSKKRMKKQQLIMTGKNGAKQQVTITSPSNARISMTRQ